MKKAFITGITGQDGSYLAVLIAIQLRAISTDIFHGTPTAIELCSSPSSSDIILELQTRLPFFNGCLTCINASV
jgi:GDP-D-mannose dehydratase